LAAAAAVVVQVVAQPVPAVVDLAHLPVPALAQVAARRAHPVQPPQLALLRLLLVRVPLPVRVAVVLAVRAFLVLAVLVGLPVLADLVVEPEVLLHLLSRQSFSATRARSSP
jgi:hypothetical protein